MLGYILAGCMAHVRKKFWHAEKTAKKEVKSDTKIIATAVLNFIKKLYFIEAKIKGRPPDEILKIRQEMSVPILDSFLNWLTDLEMSTTTSSAS
ncbi:MAG: transposase [Oligoflexus sp.]|nr:transposase [Oligoflexus sp.]